MNKKEFTQEIALACVKATLEKHELDYIDASDENKIVKFSIRIADKLYKQGDFSDSAKL